MRFTRRLLPLALLLMAAGAHAIEVDCSITVRSEPLALAISLSKTPYDLTKIDFDNGFRFAGQVLENPLRLKTYTYFDSKDRYVLIHESIVPLNVESCGKPIGDNTVYSPRLENELSFSCQLKCE